MSVRRQPWPPGTPCWLDLAAGDIEAASSFYARLLGWEIRNGPPEAGGYRLAFCRGQVVAGLRGAGGDDDTWTTYLATDDLGATSRAVRAAGGRILRGPGDLLDQATLAIAEDPTGATFGLWKAGALLGAMLVNEPGGFCWDELVTDDPARAMAFYRQVLPVEYDDQSAPSYHYAMARIGTATVGGVAGIGADGGQRVRSHWMAYFSVEDTDAVARRAAALGGHVRIAPTDSPLGRMAVLHGPGGEHFGVLQADDLPRPTED